MNDALTLGAALLLGLAASGHCLLMCGGISAALGIATAKRADGRPRPWLLVAYQLGRTSSYALAGLLFAGILGALVRVLDIESVRRSLRALSALALLIAAGVAFGRIREPGHGLGQKLWARIAPIGRRLLPVTSGARAWAFGMVWGWMPCGFVYTVLLIATVQMDAWRGAATMAAFGLGTLPAMALAAFGAQRFAGFSARPAARWIAGFALLAAAALTLAGPWLPELPWLHACLPFACSAH
ncbi:MAG: sulfite exporter TauE/SafE family protein [Proteobacteria bacterium]|nr:sulfite exporter TauE/SafE family protein [Pseudomonadota bacterium]MBS0462757.1 sulfite exporter TauE/SafE family protein [Pseudomonadota bacterium]